MNEAALQRGLVGGGLGLAGSGLAGGYLSDNLTADKMFGAMTLAGLLASAGASRPIQKILRDQHVFSAEGRGMKRELADLKKANYKDPFEDQLAQLEAAMRGEPVRRAKPVEPSKPTDPKMHTDRIAELKEELAAIQPEAAYNKQLEALQKDISSGKLYIKNHPEKAAGLQGVLDERLDALNKHVANKDQIMKDLEMGNYRRSRQLLSELQKHQSHLDNLLKPRQATPEQTTHFLNDQLADITARDANKNLLLGSGLGALAGGYIGSN